MNIAEKMEDLIRHLETEGLNDITFPDIQREALEDWGEDYAIAFDFRYYDGYGDMSSYFDEASLFRDLTELITETFTGDPTVIVKFHGWPYDISEVEVYRELGRGKFVREEETGKIYIMMDEERCTDGVAVTTLGDIDPWHRAYATQISHEVVENLTQSLETDR